ncbi:MAG: hypothetical protein BroJett003_00320 [Planctomycetota bacterium]|nr:MAG: hypothetical protein BroJett003_00320 [Planctomycetota bacterium]
MSTTSEGYDASSPATSSIHKAGDGGTDDARISTASSDAPVAESAAAPGTARRSSFLILLLSPLTLLAAPRWTASRLAGERLGRMYAWHVVMSGLILLASFFFTSTFDGNWNRGTGPWQTFNQELEDLIPVRGLSAGEIGFITLVLGEWELGLIVAALIIMPWGAVQERLTSSFRHALRTIYLFLPAPVVLLVLLGLLGYWIDAAVAARLFEFKRVPPEAPPMPASILGTPGTEAEWAEFKTKADVYQREMQAHYAEHQAAWEAHYASLPLPVRYPDEARATLVFLAIAFGVRALLACAGVARPPSAPPRAPTCEFCGYNLTHLVEPRCPECGESAERALGRCFHAGSPWERRQTLGRIAAYLDTAILALTAPRELGRQVRGASPSPQWRSFVGVSLLLTFAVTVLGFIFAILVGADGDPFREDRPEMVAVLICFGIGCTLVGLAELLIAALLIGLLAGWQTRRNLLPAAMQMAGYQSGYLVLWAAAGALWSTAIVRDLDRGSFFQTASHSLGQGRFVLGMLTWWFLNLLVVLAQLTLLWRGTRVAQHANR